MTSIGTGMRDNPVPAALPRGCYWFTDPDGVLCLSPGCMARIQYPDAQCLCGTLTARLDRLTGSPAGCGTWRSATSTPTSGGRP
ncbi:hypothetical protein [Streptomyces rubiginosohelvolus]